jgi:hypothetical protein
MRLAATAHPGVLRWISLLLVVTMLSGMLLPRLAASSTAAADIPPCHSMAGAGHADDAGARDGNVVDEFRCVYASIVLSIAPPFHIDHRVSDSPAPMAVSETSRIERPPLPPPRA